MDSNKNDHVEEILIVEDSSTQDEMLKFLLEKHDYHVSVANNGMGALELMNKHKPKLVITDIIMPEMDGYQLCRHIKENEYLKDVPVILLTALSEPDDILKGLECGAEYFITKPYEEKYLISRIQYVFANKLMHETDKLQMGIEIVFGNKKYYITSERQQILNLLLSTYETAVQKNLELLRIQDELKILNEELEEKVEERTKSLRVEVKERKRAENALKMALKNWQDTFNAISDSVFILDPEGRIIQSNGVLEHMMGINSKDVIGQHCHETFHGIPDFIEGCPFKRMKKTRMRELFEFEDKAHGLWFQVTVDPIYNESGELINAVHIMRNVTELKKMEEVHFKNIQLKIADKMKSDFLAHMSHELRTPLNSIIGFSELLKTMTAGELNEKQVHYVDNIRESSKHLLALINDILDLSKVEAGKIELTIDKISVPNAINEVVNLIKERAIKSNVSIKKDIEPQLEIMADRQRFKQILFNLLSNAVKFNKPEGGEVKITGRKEDDMVKISVSDTGIGIREENMNKLYQEFEQIDSGNVRKYEGTGLGLAITKKLVELHGGKIWAKSKYGEGSTFIFTIPLKNPKTICIYQAIDL